MKVLVTRKNPAKVDKKNTKAFSPLKIAAKRGFARIVEILIKEGEADLDYIGLLFSCNSSCVYTGCLIIIVPLQNKR